MKRASLRLLITAAVLVGAFASVACGGTAQEPTPTAEPTAGQGTDVASPTATTTSGDGPASTGTLTVAIDVLHTSPDPRVGARTSWAEFHTLTHDALLDADPFTGELILAAATSWSASPDAKSWTYTLRDDMTFHDGHPVTAEDVAFGIEWQLSELTTVNNFFYYRELVESVEVIDSHTLTVHLNTASPTWDYDSSPVVEPVAVIIPKHYIEDNNVVESDPNGLMQTDPLGSGPWMFREAHIGDRWVWDAWEEPHAYRPTPAFDELVFLEVAEMSTRVALSSTGEIDIFELTAEALPQLEAEGLEYVFIPETNQATLRFLNVWDPRAPEDHPFRDIRVRKAISMSIDRELLINTIMGGAATFPIGTAVWTSTSGLDVEAEAARSREVLRFDPEEAKRLLAEAGYPNGEGFPEVLWHSADAQTYLGDLTIAAVPMVADNLNIPLSLSFSPPGVHGDRFKQDGPNDRALVASMDTRRTACRPLPFSRWQSGLHPHDAESITGRIVESTGEELWAGPYMPEWLELDERAVNATTVEEYNAVVQDIKHWIEDSYIWPGLVSGGGLYGYNPEMVAPWEGTPCRTEIARSMEHVRPAS